MSLIALSIGLSYLFFWTWLSSFNSMVFAPLLWFYHWWFGKWLRVAFFSSDGKNGITYPINGIDLLIPSSGSEWRLCPPSFSCLSRQGSGCYGWGKASSSFSSRFDIRNTIHTYCRDFFITPQLHVSLPGRMQLAIYWKTATQTRVASLYPCRIHVNISKNNLGSFRRIIVTFVTKPGYWKKGELLPS